MGDKFNPIHVIIDNLKLIVDRSLDEDNPDKYFLDYYTNLRENIKKIKGTGSGITGIIELLYFSYIKKFLEKEFNLNWETDKSSVNVFCTDYNGSKFIMTSDVLIGGKNKRILPLFDKEEGKPFNYKPDVFIGIENNGTIKPIMFGEIKLSSDRDRITPLLKKFKTLKKIFPSEKPYFVLIYLESRDADTDNELMEEFLDISKDQCLLVRFIWLGPKRGWDEENYTYKGRFTNNSIQEISKIIMKKIRSVIKES